MPAAARRVLILGRNGQVGSALSALSWPNDWKVVAWGRDDLDLADDPERVEERVADERFDLLVNCAAYTQVDRAEDEPELAEAVNAAAVGALSRAATTKNAPILHLSTDYVFDGSLGRPYRPDDPISPLGAYGASKAAGEALLREITARHWIVRTSWVFGVNGANFLRSVLSASRDRSELTIVDDQIGCPSPALLIADRLRALVLAWASAESERAPFGTYHLAGDESTSWYGLARSAFEVLDRHRPDWPRPLITPITTAEWPTKARRPADSRLDGWDHLPRSGLSPLPWRSVLDGIVVEIARSIAPPTETKKDSE